MPCVLAVEQDVGKTLESTTKHCFAFQEDARLTLVCPEMIGLRRYEEELGPQSTLDMSFE